MKLKSHCPFASGVSGAGARVHRCRSLCVQRNRLDLRAMERLPRQVTLDELRENNAVKKLKFLKNVRLIISQVSDEEYQEILRMAGIVATPGLPLP